jgi:drug/metabolite transporter (DMT)-like permease
VTLAFAVMLKRERATWQAVTGIVLGLVGALILILPRGGVDLSANASLGNILLFMGASSYSLYLVLTRPILSRHDPLRVVSWMFLFAGLTVLPFGFNGLRAVFASGLTTAGWLSVAYAVVGATALPYLLNNWALVRVQASVVAIYILVQPLVAGALGRIFLGESLGAHTAVAATLIVGGVVVATSRRTG